MENIEINIFVTDKRYLDIGKMCEKYFEDKNLVNNFFINLIII